MADRPLPWEKLSDRVPNQPEAPGFVVDLRRCIGCHACSVACKTAHEVPLGEFPLRVRWLPRAPREERGQTGVEVGGASESTGNESVHPPGTYAFVPVFSESLCREDPASQRAGLDPVCVRACPTDVLRFGDVADPTASVSRVAAAHSAQPLEATDATDLKKQVRYVGLEAWMAGKLNRGAALDPRDEDPIYEQR